MTRRDREVAEIQDRIQHRLVAALAVAAEALISGGAEEVLLFGSVARGDADESSDIDLVAVFADIDYRGAARACWTP